MNNSVEQKLSGLRHDMATRNLDAYIVPRADEHLGEYVPPQNERLYWVSGFRGSAGLVIVLRNSAAIFVDGRYTIQSQIESGKNFKIMNFEKLLNCNLFKNLTLGIDPKLFTNTQIKNYFLRNNSIKFIKKNLIDEIKKQKKTLLFLFFH